MGVPSPKRKTIILLLGALLLILITVLVSGGRVSIHAVGSVYAVALQEDGKLVTAGSRQGDVIVARHLPNGRRDAGFGQDGFTATHVAGFEVASNIALLPDGKILVLGSGDTDGYPKDQYHFLARFLPDGSLDASFGDQGLVVSNTVSSYGTLKDIFMAVQPDGKIIVAGERRLQSNPDQPGNLQDIALTRYHADGSLDLDFGVNGLVITDSACTEYPIGVVLQSDGKIVIVADYLPCDDHPHRIALIRYTLDGQVDASFGQEGFAITDGDPDSTGSNLLPGSSSAVTIDPDDNILVASASYQIDEINVDFAWLRFDPDGFQHPDLGPGTGGIVHTEIGASDDRPLAILIQPDGKVLVAGTSDGRFALVRYNPDGSLDPSFGDHGIEVNAGTVAAFAIALQDDGKIILAGAGPDGILFPRDLTNGLLARYRPNGKLDRTFGLLP